MPRIRLFMMGLVAILPRSDGSGLDVVASPSGPSPDPMRHVPVFAWDETNVSPVGATPESQPCICKEGKVRALYISDRMEVTISAPGAGPIGAYLQPPSGVNDKVPRTGEHVPQAADSDSPLWLVDSQAIGLGPLAAGLRSGRDRIGRELPALFRVMDLNGPNTPSVLRTYAFSTWDADAQELAALAFEESCPADSHPCIRRSAADVLELDMTIADKTIVSVNQVPIDRSTRSTTILRFEMAGQDVDLLVGNLPTSLLPQPSQCSMLKHFQLYDPLLAAARHRRGSTLGPSR